MEKQNKLHIGDFWDFLETCMLLVFGAGAAVVAVVMFERMLYVLFGPVDISLRIAWREVFHTNQYEMAVLAAMWAVACGIASYQSFRKALRE